MIVALGSIRGPKVEAVRRALGRLRSLAPELAGAELEARDVGVVAPAMPCSWDELVAGARARAMAALAALEREGRVAGLGLGLEGGLELRGAGVARRAYLMSWACASDGRREVFGCGGALELPQPLLHAVVDAGQELGHAIDAFSGGHDVRSGAGAWGVITAGLVDRTLSFELAVLNALAPFYNASLYR
jgi:inosine/xanthosine triphosphatase